MCEIQHAVLKACYCFRKSVDFDFMSVGEILGLLSKQLCSLNSSVDGSELSSEESLVDDAVLFVVCGDVGIKSFGEC